MTPRERLLAIGVGATVGLFGVSYGFNSIRSGLAAKQTLADNARLNLEKAEMIVDSGKAAAEKINVLKVKSLPGSEEALVAQYRDWLLQLGKQCGIKDLSVATPKSPFKRAQAYTAYDFSVSGIAQTDQVIELIGRFYDKDYLHSIHKVSIDKSKNPNEVKVIIEARAVTLKGVDDKQLPSEESSGRLAMKIDDYKRAILNRNPFSPPNQAPKVSSSLQQTVELGKSWNHRLEASDAENHLVNFELVSTELPEGMSFSSGEFDWNPKELGEYEVVVRASDNGWPRQSIEEKLTLRVVEPPKEEPVEVVPKFDAATQAFITAIMGGRSGSEGWLRSRVDGETITLKEGNEFEVGSIKAKVVGVNLKEDFVELETDGRRWIVGMDTSLAEAYQKSQVD